jgi:hypothetical protein
MKILIKIWNYIRYRRWAVDPLYRPMSKEEFEEYRKFIKDNSMNILRMI